MANMQEEESSSTTVISTMSEAIVDNQDLESKQKTREAKRVNILQEILSTEKSYVKTLYILNSHYIRPISRGKILSKEVHKKIFNEIEMIIKINENFLKELENILIGQNSVQRSNTTTSPLITPLSKITGGFSHEESVTGFRVDPFASQFSQLASLLLFFAESFKLYIGYITNFKNASDEVTAEKKRNKQFKELCTAKHKLLQKEKQQITNLEGFLIVPIQRIPRYRLLMEELLSRMDQNDECYEQIRKASEYISTIATYCNEKSSHIDKSSRILDIVEKLKLDRMEFVKPSRRFICEELDSIKLLKGKKLIPCDIYLFSDILLVSTFPISFFGRRAKKPLVQRMSLKIGSQCPERKDKQVGRIAITQIYNNIQNEETGLSIRCYYQNHKADFSASSASLQSSRGSDKWIYEIRLVCDTKEQAARLRESIENCQK
jgi:hypothetical protein